jgi:hypothetical protein
MNLPFPFRGDPPDREHAVLCEPVPYNPQRWLAYLPDALLWPDDLDTRVADTWPCVDRERVLVVGRRATDSSGALHTYVAAAVWGSGTNARGVARRCRPLADEPADVGVRLAEAVDILLDDAGGAVAAYDALHDDGRLRVPYVGPSFGTKVLYFSGFDRVADDLQPLILDRFVAAGLNHLCDLGWPTTGGGWSTDQYASYLRLAHDWADTWGCRPDVVERVLAAIGHADPVAIRALALPADLGTGDEPAAEPGQPAA